jgi:hypothetical protein
MQHLSFKNRNTGRVKRAAFHLRLGRMIRRKRVAYARLAAAHALKQAQREIARVYQLAAAHDVPLDAMAPLPALPLLPGQAWIEHRQALGELAPAVVAKPAEQIQASA